MPANEYLPFRAINVFIDDDNLKKTLKDILEHINILPKEDQIAFVNLFKEYVTILGFRNPLHAPLPLQVNAYLKAFEDKDEVIPFTLSTWTKIEPDLAKTVEEWLQSEGWKNLCLQRSFEDSQGFIRDWPDSSTVEDLISDFKKRHPDLEYEDHDLILMALWISGRLPEEESGL
jgi:hypothetical protein